MKNALAQIDRKETDLRYSRFTPLEILENTELSHAACRLWLLMFIEYKRFLNLSENKRNILCYYKTNKTLGSMIGLSEKQAERLTKELRDNGYLLSLRNFNSSSFHIPIHPADVSYNSTVSIYNKITETRCKKAALFINTNLPDSIYNHKPNVEIRSVDEYSAFKVWCNNTFFDNNIEIDTDNKMAYFPDRFTFSILTDEDFNKSLDEFGLLIVDLPEWHSRHHHVDEGDNKSVAVVVDG